MSAGWPKTSTGRMPLSCHSGARPLARQPLPRPLDRRRCRSSAAAWRTSAGSILPVCGSTSTKTGTALSKSSTLVEATNEKGVVITRSVAPSWSPMPAARTHRCSPAVPELTPMACLLPVYWRKLSSKAWISLAHAQVGGAQDGRHRLALGVGQVGGGHGHFGIRGIRCYVGSRVAPGM